MHGRGVGCFSVIARARVCVSLLIPRLALNRSDWQHSKLLAAAEGGGFCSVVVPTDVTAAVVNAAGGAPLAPRYAAADWQ